MCIIGIFVNALSVVKLIVYRNYDLPGTSKCRIIPPHAIQLSPYCALYFNETIKKLPKQNANKSINLTRRYPAVILLKTEFTFTCRCKRTSQIAIYKIILDKSHDQHLIVTPNC